MIDFLFPRTLRRLPYFLRSIVVSILIGLLLPIHEEIVPGFSNDYIACMALALVIFLYDVLYVMRPRCKDAGFSLWFLLLVLVPILDGLFILFLLFSGSRSDRFIVRDSSKQPLSDESINARQDGAHNGDKL